MATSQLSLYNGALRILKNAPLDTETDDRPERYALDAAYEDGLVYCLELAAWNFASRSATLATAGASGMGYSRSVAFPTDYVKTIILSDQSSYFPPLENYATAGRTFFAEASNLYLTYVSKDASYGLDMTKWPITFAKVVEAHLAMEICPVVSSSMDGLKYARAVFQERLDLAIAKDAINRNKRVLSSEVEDVYRGALRLLGKRTVETHSDELISGRLSSQPEPAEDGSAPPPRRRDDTVRSEAYLRALLDECYDDVIDSCLEQGLWNWASRTIQIEPSVDVEPEFGMIYAFEKPSDYVRLDSISSDERFVQPLQDFKDEGDYWFSDESILYVSYISNGDDYGRQISRWPRTFKAMVEHELAFQIAPSAGLGVTRLADLEKKRNQSMRDARSKDAMNQPSKRIPAGRLVRSRTGSYTSRGER